VTTYTNVSIPRESDVRAQQYLHAAEQERDFWLKKAEDFRNRLEAILDAAKEHGYVELHHRNEKLVLYTWQKAAELDAPL
jgi:hypothetical protein